MKPTNEEEFWREQFSSGQSIISLPYNNLSQGSLNKEQSYTVHSFQSVLSPEISHKLISITKGSNMGLFIILLAGVQALLHKYTDEEDVILGIPALPEDDDELSPINDIIMIKNQFNRNQSFRLLLNEVKLSVQEAIENQNIPFWKMIQNLHIEHDVNGLPVINTLVSYKQLHPFDYSKEIRTDIIFEFDLVDNDIVLNVKYNDHHYYQSFISQMINHLNQLFSGVLQQPELELHKLDLLLENERNQLLHDFNSTTAEHQKEKAIHQLFEDQVSRSPDAIAVIFDDEKWTYRELNDRANQLAHTLRANGIQAEQLVGLMVERSFHMIVGMLAILKAGGAYVPIDPEYPEERVRYMLQDSGAQILLTQSELVHHISFEGKTILLENQDQYHDDRSNLEYQYNPNHLAYVIYTSGTTGNPKGVMVEHANLVDYVQTFVQEFQIVQDDHFLQQASISFDTSVEELYPPLVTGASLVITSKDDMLDSKILAEKIAQEKISIVSCSPLLLNELNKHLHDHSVRIFISGGDVLFKSHFLNLVPAKVYNTYGPTEGTVCATYYQCTYDEQQSIPIGKPIANKKVYILNASNQLQPIGVPGELCVAGTGVARGYLNRPELTAEKFVANPFEPSEVMYRTGDAARWLPDGNIEYIGRLDNQVKIRGYRIELGEVEAQLLNIDSVQEAVVTAHEDTSGEKNLCAYYVSSLTWSISELREKLVQALPAYMIPTYFVQLEQLPTTSNGKVDRKALPAPEAALQSSAEYVAPRTEEEEKLVQIWREVLGVEKIGVKDHFFDLGGHSLRAMNLVSKINKEMNVNLPLRAVFRSPTVEAMAEVIGGLEKNQHMSIPKVSDSDVYPVSSAQKRLYILHQLVGGEQSYNMPSELILEGPLDRERLENVFLELIHRHETLRTCFEMVEGEPVQRIQSDVHFEMPYIQAGEKEINEIVQDFVRPFDLEKAPLLRVGLVEEHKDRHILMLDMHHIISDGVSIEILIHELVQLYHGKELSPLRIQYKDYAVWQQSEVQSEQMKQQEAYWLKSFANELPVLELPTDYPRPAVQNFAGSLYEFVIDQDISKKIEKVANQSGATMYMVLLAAYKTLLYKYSGQEDLIVGTPIAGRQHADLEPLIGMFVNTLAIRSYPSGEKTFKEFLEEVKETTLEAYENQDYPFEELVENLNLGRDLSRNVLFDTLFALQNTEQEKLELEGLNIKPYPQEHKVAKFDLTFTIEEAEEGLLCEIEYATTLYNHVTIERMATHFKELLEAVVESPEETLASYHMIPDEEKKQLLYSFNDTRADYPTEKAVHQLFEEQVERTPDAVAVVQNGQSLTYGELNERANQLART
uniref:non-ribosomal peptide synthetase n=1 Tax=Caldalkalibacillus mannanilyticus TaxID=1418 RepID=UPI00046B0577